MASLLLQPGMIPSCSAPPEMTGGLTIPAWPPRPLRRAYRPAGAAAPHPLVGGPPHPPGVAPPPAPPRVPAGGRRRRLPAGRAPPQPPRGRAGAAGRRPSHVVTCESTTGKTHASSRPRAREGVGEDGRHLQPVNACPL